MYHPANYYAARTAAIKEALEEERARAAAAQQKPASVFAPTGADAYRECGRQLKVTLGPCMGDLAGTIVDAVYCYSIGSSMYMAKFVQPISKETLLACVASYSRRDDVYNLVISVAAIL